MAKQISHKLDIAFEAHRFDVVQKFHHQVVELAAGLQRSHSCLSYIEDSDLDQNQEIQEIKIQFEKCDDSAARRFHRDVLTLARRLKQSGLCQDFSESFAAGPFAPAPAKRDLALNSSPLGFDDIIDLEPDVL